MKRRLYKLSMTVAAVATAALLQGCGEEEDGLVIMNAWMPVGSSLRIEPHFAPAGTTVATLPAQTAATATTAAP